jgi:hypothetical protein
LSSDCPNKNCGMHFIAPLMRDAHARRYPSHFTDKPAPNLQVDALPQIYQTKRKRRKQTEETEEPTDE